MPLPASVNPYFSSHSHLPQCPDTSWLYNALSTQESTDRMHRLSPIGHSPGGLKTMMSSNSLDISCSRTAKVIFPFCSKVLRNWTIWWIKAWHFGTASWKTNKKDHLNEAKQWVTTNDCWEYGTALNAHWAEWRWCIRSCPRTSP